MKYSSLEVWDLLRYTLRLPPRPTVVTMATEITLITAQYRNGYRTRAIPPRFTLLFEGREVYTVKTGRPVCVTL